MLGVGVFAIAGATSAAAEPAPADACVYASKNYSSGAYLCLNKSLMLSCSIDGGHPAWKTVSEPQLSGACTANEDFVVERRSRRAHFHRRVMSRAPPVTPTSAKCFEFAGKRYCE